MAGCFGQILPTVPANIFRITLSNYSTIGEFKLKDQDFNMRGIGRSYFDDETKNNLGFFNGAHDLYHMGDMLINDLVTIESYLTNFNVINGTSLPVFNAGYYDTTRTAIPYGTFTELKERKEKGRKIRIDYGVSNEMMLSVIVPNIFSLKEEYKASATIDRIYGVDDLIDYHNGAMAKIDSFFQTITFITLPSGTRDTLNMIYDDFYSDGGSHSVLWALHAQNKPFSRGFIDPRFMSPNFSYGDTVTFDSLQSYYVPSLRSASGINDISLGVTALLKGEPSWTSNKAGVLYGRVFLSIPFGFTIEPFKEVGIKQLTQLNIGSGVSRVSLGLYGGYNWNNKSSSRVYGSIDIISSAPELLYTPINLFAGAHTNPDSIISKVGETYKLNEGNWLKSLVGYEFEISKDKLLLKFESRTISKSRDDYTSLDKGWDKWMEKHKGYDSANSRWDLCGEVWVLNSKSKKRIGPLSFDLVLGIRKTINANNTFDGYKLYSGITTYLQGW